MSDTFMINGAVWSHSQKRFKHKTQKRFSHSGLVTLSSKFGYINTIKIKSKIGKVSAVFTNILYYYTHQLANNE